MKRCLGTQRNSIALAMMALLPACASVDDVPRGDAAYAIAPPAPAVGTDYRLGSDDVLRIQVYHEPGLSLEDARIDAAGTVKMPLIGDVPVAGLSAGDAADAIARRLGERYLVSPQVTIFVKNAVSRRITVDGEVRNPGLFPIDGRLLLSQAVALANGPSRLASLSHIVVIRTVDANRQAAMFDLGAIRRGTAADPEILPGDQVVVGLSQAKAILGGALLAMPALATGFIALDGHR